MAKTNPSYTIDTTFSGKDITSASSVYQFTSAASQKVQFIFKITNASGAGGDYAVFLKRQWGGAGATSTAYGKSTFTVDSGDADIEFDTMEINVKVGDVVDIMVLGLAGDSSVNGNIRIVADNPSILEQSDILNDATPFAGADIASIPVDVWEYGTRTLTITVAKVSSVAEDGDDLSVLRGDTLSISISGLGSIASRSKLYFTARKLTIKADSDSIIQVEETLNMLYLMGATPVLPIVAADATITVDDEDNGDITILIKPRASKEFVQGDFEYDVEVVNADESVYTLVEGTFAVRQDVTRATT